MSRRSVAVSVAERRLSAPPPAGMIASEFPRDTTTRPSGAQAPPYARPPGSSASTVGGPPVTGHLLHLVVREVRDPLAVGREERLLTTFGARERMHTEFVHPSHEDLERPIAAPARERDHVAVGRNRDRVGDRRRDPDVRGKAEDEAEGGLRRASGDGAVKGPRGECERERGDSGQHGRDRRPGREGVRT